MNKAATRTIPLVVITADPVAAGFLTGLAHPGGTGVSINAGTEIYGKRMQILKEAMPNTAKVAVLLSGSWTNADGMSAYREAAKQLGIELIAKKDGNPYDYLWDDERPSFFVPPQSL